MQKNEPAVVIGLDPGPSSVISMSVDDSGRALYAPLSPGAQVVITVPTTYDDAQRQRIKEQARAQGLEVLRVISSATAVALAHGIDRQDGLALIYERSQSLELTVLEISDGICEVLQTERIEGLDLERSLDAAARLIAACGRGLADVDVVALSGPASREPLLRALVEQRFGKPALQLEAPELTRAQGAAVMGRLLGGPRVEMISLEVTPLSLSIEREDGRALPIIPRSSMIPYARKLRFAPSARPARLSVLRGERALAKHNELLLEARLELIDEPIDVLAEIDPGGALSISARGARSGRHQRWCPPEEQAALDSGRIDAILKDAQRKAPEDEVALAKLERAALMRSLEGLRPRLGHARWRQLEALVYETALAAVQERVERALGAMLRMKAGDLQAVFARLPALPS